MKLLIKNGFLISKSYYGKYDIEINNQKITKVAKHIAINDHKLIDADGCYVFPGLIDAHTHFNLEAYGAKTLEDFPKGTRTALLNGVTTVIDYIIPQKSETLLAAYHRRLKEAAGSFVDYTFHAQIVDVNEDFSTLIKKLISYGIKSFKIFLPKTENWYIDDGKLYIILNELKKYKNVVLEIHAENSDIINVLTEKLKNEDKLSVKYFPLSRPNVVEYEAVRRVISINNKVGCNIYFVHLSTKDALEEIIYWKKQKNKNFNIYAETCPQYLYLTRNVFKIKKNYLYTCCPPVKSLSDKIFLWKCVRNSIVDVIATDNCVFSKKMKFRFRDNFTKIPMGLPGTSMLFHFVITESIKRRLNLRNIIKMVTSTPAKIFSLYPKKGDFLALKSDADIIIYYPKEKWRVNVKRLNTVADYTVYEGYEVYGKILKVIFKGNLVVDNGKLLISQPQGAYIPR
ncbi:MAG: amidohydrolase family protein [Endomicrobia bacterium]|nr:amidohydrolase family protein [Endomicrobiia bacterium]